MYVPDTPALSGCIAHAHPLAQPPYCVQLKMAIETFSVVDEVKVDYSSFDATGVDELCTPGGSGNVITVTFLRTRLDVALKGDLPPLVATGKDLHRK